MIWYFLITALIIWVALVIIEKVKRKPDGSYKILDAGKYIEAVAKQKGKR